MDDTTTTQKSEECLGEKSRDALKQILKTKNGIFRDIYAYTILKDIFDEIMLIQVIGMMN